jgi:hypothetical protein
LADSESKQSFWTTIPGMLTGLAAVLTAATGLFLAIYHPASGDSDQPKRAPIVDGDARPAPAAPLPTTATNPLSPPAPLPTTVDAGPQGSVTMRSRADETTQLALKSFKHNFTADALQLSSGQTISFEKIHIMDFLTVDGDAHQVSLKITLLDGRVVNGSLPTGYAFKGESDLGPFTIFLTDVKQVILNH